MVQIQSSEPIRRPIGFVPRLWCGDPQFVWSNHEVTWWDVLEFNEFHQMYLFPDIPDDADWKISTQQPCTNALSAIYAT